MYYGSIEAGGTKFVCALGNENFKIVDSMQCPTTTPEETLGEVIAYFSRFKDKLKAISVASFGPTDVIKSSETYGYITTTPKPYWSNIDLIGALKEHFDVPYYFTTDVNASAYGEYLVRRNVKGLVYYTIGTGIGGGIIQEGMEIGTFGHTELGHVYVQHHPRDTHFIGTCPYHKNCLEGLAAGPSLEARTGIRGECLPLEHDVWDIQAFYIAQAAVQATLSFRPEVIVFGGGVMGQHHMLERVKREFVRLLNGYVNIPNIDNYIVTPIVDNNGSATIGNFALAKKLVEQQ